MFTPILPLTTKTPYKLQSFLREDSGAVTTDWVLLTAACVSLAIVVLSSVGAGTVTAAETVERGLEESSRTIFCGDAPCN